MFSCRQSGAAQLRRVSGNALVACALLSVSAVSGEAQDFRTGFESPTYSTGNLAGQNGWNVFQPGCSSVQVQTSVVKSGAQAVRVTPTGTSNCQTGPWRATTPAGPLVGLSADFYLASSSTQSGWQFAGLGAGLVQFIGGINISPTNVMRLITNGTPVVGPLVVRDAWHRVDFVFDFTAQQYSFAFNGTTLASNVAFCGSNAGCTGANVAAYGSTIFDAFSRPGSNDFGVIDNLAVSTVPEPASLALLASGLAAVGVMVRRRRTR